MDKKNTKITYLYRDADNYKQTNEAVLAGIFNPADLELIECINEYELFVPEQVGLHLTRPDDEYTESDHCWAEIDPSEDIVLTEEVPTEDITWEQLIANYKEVEKDGWQPEKFVPVSCC